MPIVNFEDSENKMTKSKEKTPVVLQVLPAFGQGGVERGTLQIAEGLHKNGIKSFVASAGGRLEAQLKKIDTEHFTLPLTAKNPIKIIKNAFALKKIIKDKGINIVHARSRAPAWSAYLAAKWSGVKFVTTFHGTYGLGPMGIKKVYNKIMTMGEIVIAISNHIKNHILQNYPKTNPDKIRLIYRCVDVDNFDPKSVTSERMISFIKQFNIPNDKPIILSTGRLTHWKGQHLLIEALGKLKNKEFFCVLLGDPQGRNNYVDGLKELIKKYKLKGNVAFVPDTTDVPALMMLANIVTSTAIEPEAFGRMTIEGQAMEKIVIASNIGGSLENLIDGKTGKLFESGNADDLAAKLEWALSLNDAEKEKIGKAARKYVKDNFTKEIMCDKTIDVYKELLNSK